MINGIKYFFLLFTSKIWYSFSKRDKKTWVFGEWFGDRCCDNCLYFANYVTETFPDIHVIWIASKRADLSKLNPSIDVAIMDSPEAIRALRYAGVVFVVQALYDLTHKNICYHSGALVVNMWHGVPWKKIQIDAERNFKHRFLKSLEIKALGAKLLLSTSLKFDTILNTSFKCKRKNILKAGYPRNALFYKTDRVKECRLKMLQHLEQHGVNVNFDTKIITYMPTFRDKTNERFSFCNILNNETLRKILEDYNAIILEKNHYVSHKRETYNCSAISSGRFMQLDDYATQDVLASSDILITDYSSCFFDYLLLDRPIIHYLYDYRYYKENDRGLYYSKEEVICGDTVDNVEALIRAIKQNLCDNSRHTNLRKKRRKEFLSYESDSACRIIYSEIAGKLKMKVF